MARLPTTRQPPTRAPTSPTPVASRPTTTATRAPTSPTSTTTSATKPRTTTTGTRIVSRPVTEGSPLLAEAVSRSRPIYIPTFVKPILRGDVTRRLQPTADLRALLNSPPSLTSRATKEHDGRLDKLVLLVVHDKAGDPIPGVAVRLLAGDQLRDNTRTDKRGVAIVVLPDAHHGTGHDAAPPAHRTLAMPAPGPLRVELLMRDLPPIVKTVQLPPGRQHQVMDVLIDVPRATSVPIDGETSMAMADVPAPLKPLVELRYNPLDRLPADFSTELCQDLKNFFGPTEDPIFGLVEGSSDFRQRRIPLVKRDVAMRLGATKPDKSPPRRYLVRTRQEWTFLGYTLGELVEAEPLDPGAIINEATRTVDRAVKNVSRSLEEVVQNMSESTHSALSSAASIDSVLRVATSVRSSAGAAGFGLFLGPIGIGAAGATARVTTNTSVRSRVDTSLEVNSSLHFAKSVVNSAARTAQSMRRDLQSTVSTALNQVSPLLSRVTNLLRWTLYENYMVCTHVEDVVEVVDVRIASLGSPDTPLFTDEQIVDLRRIFSPGLLEPRLRSQFDRLAAAVDARRGGDLPITAIHVDVEYAQSYGNSTLTLRCGGDETSLTLRGGATRARGVIRLPSPRDDSLITDMEASLTLHDVQTILGTVVLPNQVLVSRIELGFQTASGLIRRVAIRPGDSLRATHETRTDTMSADVTIPPPAIFTEHNPLVVHINANRTYYFGLLCQAALAEPSLRDDMPHFEAFDSDHEIWRLPIIGFEGDRALVLKDADRTLEEVQELLADPGAATLIQLAAPGAYAEALQGLLKLAVDTEAIHPALLPAPAPVLPPLAIINGLTGGTVPVVGGTNGGASPVPTPVPIPGGSTGTGGPGGTGGLPIPPLP